MLIIIKSLVKIKIRSVFFKIGIIVVTLLSILTAYNLNYKTEFEDVYSDTQSWSVPMLQATLTDKTKKSRVEEDEKYLKILKNKMDSAEKLEDWKTYELSAMELSSYLAQYCETSRPMDSNFDYFRYKNEISAIQKEYDFLTMDDYKQDISTKSQFYTLYPTMQKAARYFNKLYENGWKPLKNSHSDGSTFLLQWSRSSFVYLIPILLCFLFVNDFFKFRKDGTLKLIYTVDKFEKKFIPAYLISNVIVSILLLAIPVCFVSLCLSIINGFTSFSYPVLVNIKGLIGPYFVENTMLNQVSSVYNGLTTTHVGLQMDPSVDYISLGTVNFLIVLMLLMNILFHVQVILLLSNVIKDTRGALIVYMILIFALTIASPIGNMNVLNLINPMTYRDPMSNIDGTNYFSYFSGMMIFFLYSICLYFSNKKVFKKQRYSN